MEVDIIEQDIKGKIFYYLSFWKWIVLSSIISLSICYYYLKFKNPSYKVEATILIKDNEKGGLNSEMAAFQDLGIGLNTGGSAIDNEIEILRSRFLYTKIAQDLKLNISYYDNNGFNKKEIYKGKIFSVSFVNGDTSSYDFKGDLNIEILNKNEFIIKGNTNSDSKVEKFGKAFNTKQLKQIIIIPTKKIQKYIHENYIIHFETIHSTVEYLKSNVVIDKVNKESSALSISMKIEDIDKGKAIINNLIEQHSKDAVEDKNLVAKNTIIFINDRISNLTKELSSVEKDVSEFKSNNDFFDLTTNANVFFENQSNNEKMLFENLTQIKLAEYIIEYLNNIAPNKLVPANIGLTNIGIEKLIETINELQLEKNKLLTISSEKNPIVNNLDNQIISLKQNLKESLNNQLNSLKLINKDLDKQNSMLNQRLDKAPRKEKDFKEIQRQQIIKESLYLYLLQKREETSISYAVTSSNTKIIDEAFSNGKIVSPRRKVIFILAIFLGLLIPICIIYILDLLDTKVKTKSDIYSTGVPYLGDIPTYEKKEKIAVKKGDRSSTTEAFRMLKTNISFIKNEHKAVKTIFVTSTLSKEGKSFVSLNLAATYGLSGKKVLLIGLDLRAPKILEYLNINSNKGVSNFLINDEVSLDNYIMKLNEIENVSILPSGPIPPNPSELLNSNKVEELFKFASDNYDIVIVDTAPVGLVTDTMQIAQYADMFLYVVRANYLEKKLLQIGQTLYNEKKLNNMSMILNGSDLEKGYGYGYGYGEEEEKIAWWKKPFTKNK